MSGKAISRACCRITERPFRYRIRKADVATEIASDACEAVADTYMSLADLRRADQWRLEYVSLRDDEQGDFFPVGEMPV